MPEWYVVWPDGSQTDPFSSEGVARKYANEQGAKVEGPFYPQRESHYCAGSYNDTRFGVSND